MKAHRFILLATAGILMGMVYIYAAGQARQPAILYTEMAEEKTINNHLSVQGMLEPARSSRISFSQSGFVAEVYVESGTPVTAGQPLLRLDNGPSPALDPVQAFSAYYQDTVTANMQDGMVLYADIDGILTSCAAQGKYLYPGQVAVTIADLSKAYVSLEVPELYASNLQTGQSAEVTAISNDSRIYSATLTQIASEITQRNDLLSQNAESVIACKLQLNEFDPSLCAGMTMDVSITTDSIARAVTVPYEAIRQDGTDEFVYVVSERGIEKRWVETGYQLSEDIQVKYGVTAGECVLTNEEIPLQFPNGYVVYAI